MSPRCIYNECDGSGFILDEETRTAYDCKCRPQLIARAKARQLSGVIPQRYAEVSFDRAPVTDISPMVVADVKQYCDNIGESLASGRGMWFQGDIGTGKTTLAMLISKTALKAGHSVAIYSLPRLLATIRDSYGDDSKSSYIELIDKLAAVELLHIDDVGTERSSEWVLEQLYSIIDARYEQQRSVILTTNLQLDQLSEQITARTVSRLTEICGEPLIVGGPDHRNMIKLPDPVQD